MSKRRAARRRPGDEAEFPVDRLPRAYRAPLMLTHLPDIDVAAVRGRLALSQERFAHRFGIPVATLRHWEQGDRKPRGCALALLHVIDYHPGFAARAILKAKSATAAASAIISPRHESIRNGI